MKEQSPFTQELSRLFRGLAALLRGSFSCVPPSTGMALSPA